MADEKATKSEEKDVNTSSESQDVKPENTVPYGRFKEINDKLKELEAAEAKRAEDEKKSKEAKMLDEKKYKELLDTKDRELAKAAKEMAEVAEKAKRFEETQTKIRDEALAKIEDKELRSLAEKFADPADVLAFVEKTTQKRGGPYGDRGKPPEKESDPLKKRKDESWSEWNTRIEQEVASRK